MKLHLDRAEADGFATRSTLLIDGGAAGFILEPAGPHGESDRRRVPAGTYDLELKPFDPADPTHPSSRFDAEAIKIMQAAGATHFGMIRLRAVPGRSEVLLHWGNWWRDSEACLLTGRSRMLWKDGTLAVGQSRKAYQIIYPRVAAAIRAVGATIEIADACEVGA